MESPPNSLRIVLPIRYCTECYHTCSNSFRMIKRIGKGSHGNVFMALHVPTMKIYAIKRVKCTPGLACKTMKLELKALTDLCRNINVDANGVVEARQTTLSHCNRCCKGSEFECIEGGIWVAKCDITEPTSPDGARKLNAPLSASLFSILTVQASASAIAHDTKGCHHIVSFFDAFPDSSADGQCIVMEYMRWGSLQDQINANHKFTEEELAVIAFSILSALVYIDAHKYIHRDIKPGNILMDATGHVKLSDFGSACPHDEKVTSPSSSSSDTQMVGTLYYMPPESFSSEGYSHKSDIWSLGVTLFHLMQGAHPFVGQRSYWALRNCINTATIETFLQPEHTSSAAITDFLAGCVALKPEDRLSAHELLQSSFLQEAIAAGALQPEDPRLKGLAEELCGDAEPSELDVIASVLTEECQGEVDCGRAAQSVSDQIGLSREALEDAIRNKKQETNHCMSQFHGCT